MAVELGLHDNRPDIYTNVEDDDGVETNLRTAALAETLHVKDVAKTKAADTGDERHWLMLILRKGLYLAPTCKRKARSETRGPGPGQRNRFLSRWSKYHCHFS